MDCINRYTELISTLQHLSTLSEEYRERSIELLGRTSTGGDNESKRMELHKQILLAFRELRTDRLRVLKFSHDLNNLGYELGALGHELDPSPYATFNFDLECLHHAYDKLMANGTVADFVEFLDCSKLVARTIEQLKAFNTMLKNSLIPVEEVERTTVSIKFSQVDSIRIVSRKLDAIANIYDHLIMMSGVSEVERPLIMKRLESGSLFVELSCDPALALVLVVAIERAAEFIYRHYSTKGKITQIPTKVEALEAVIGLRRQMSDSGLDSNEMDRFVESSSLKIAKSLDTLIGDQPEIEINNNRIGIPEMTNQDRFLELVQQQLLEDQSENSET